MTRPTAVLLLGFGGPEGPDDVIPFLENVTRGRDVPRARLDEVAEQYLRVGGVSPINEQNRALRDALQAELDRRGRGVRVHWGNRNWAPYVHDALAEIAAEGHEHAVALATSAWSSYSSCRQYLEDIAAARTTLGDGAPRVDKVRPFFDHPGFIDAQAVRVRETLSASARPVDRLVFTAHSLPEAMAATCDYEAQLREASGLVVERLESPPPWDLVYQSRSGPPQVPWLEPDVADHLRTLEAGSTVVVVPIGFVSDHMEVVHDLDTLAAAAAQEAGITMLRASTAGTHPTFVDGLVDLLDEHLVGAAPKSLSSLGPRPSPCAAGCCPPPRFS